MRAGEKTVPRPGALRLAFLAGLAMWGLEVVFATQTRADFRVGLGLVPSLAVYVVLPVAAAAIGGPIGRRFRRGTEAGRRAGLLAYLGAVTLAGAGLSVYLELAGVPLGQRAPAAIGVMLLAGLLAWQVRRRRRPSFTVAARLLVVIWGLTVCVERVPRQIVTDVMSQQWGSLGRDVMRAALLAGLCLATYPLLGLAWRRTAPALGVLAALSPIGLFAVTPPPAPARAPSGPPPRGDIFLIILDSLRYDHTSLAPDDGDATPALAGLAARGLSFHDAHSPSIETKYSLPALLGRSGEARGQAATRWSGVSAAWSRSLPARLRAAGYEIHLLSDCAAMTLDGLEVYRWDTVAARPASWFRLTGLVPAWRAILRQAPHRMHHILDDNYPYAGAGGPARRLDRLLAESDGPGFYLVHLAVPHDPYDQPPYRTRTLPPIDQQVVEPFIQRFGEDQGAVDPLKAVVYQMLYARAVRAADEQLAALLEVIERHGRAADGLIIATSDHGESLGDRGYVAHGATLHVEEHHVPLVLAGDDIPAGRTVEHLVSLDRLADTIAAWAGLPDAGERSLLRDLAPDARPEPIVVRTGAGLALQSGRWRLLWTWDDALRERPREWGHRRRFKIYDLTTDPDERHDLYRPDHPALPALLREARRLRTLDPGGPLSPGIDRPSLGGEARRPDSRGGQ